MNEVGMGRVLIAMYVPSPYQCQYSEVDISYLRQQVSVTWFPDSQPQPFTSPYLHFWASSVLAAAVVVIHISFVWGPGKWVGRIGNLASLATSSGSNKLSLRILHNRWQECIQPHMHQISTNHRLVLIYMNLAHNVFSGIYHSHIVGGKCVNSGVLRVKINSSNAVLNPIYPLLRLFGAHHIFHVAG